MVDFQSRESRRGTAEQDTSGGPDEAESSEASESVAAGGGFAVVGVETANSAAAEAVAAVVETVKQAGESVVTRERIPADHDEVQRTVDAVGARDDVDAVLTVGGVGVAPDDVTVAAVSPLVDTTLPGFGEVYRRKRADAVGTDVVASRVTAGLLDRTPLFCLPGESESAVVAVDAIVLEQAGRIGRLAAGE